MAETPSKRQREDSQVEIETGVEESKRQKSYNHILSILEEDDEEPNQDLSSLIITLQQELSNSDSLSLPTSQNDLQNQPIPPFSSFEDYNNSSPSTSSSSFSSSADALKEDEEDERERVMRHLLEASDDELGIPNSGVQSVSDEGEAVGYNGGDGFGFEDAFWELEDEAANYYALLQTELFM